MDIQPPARLATRELAKNRVLSRLNTLLLAGEKVPFARLFWLELDLWIRPSPQHQQIFLPSLFCFRYLA
jgi:hypothetical protein